MLYIYKYDLYLFFYSKKVLIWRQRAGRFNRLTMFFFMTLGYLTIDFPVGYYFKIGTRLYALSNFESLKSIKFSKSLSNLVAETIAGKLRRYRTFLHLYGLGNRILEIHSDHLLLKLGFAHNITVKRFRHMYFEDTTYRKKNSFMITGSNIVSLNNFVFLVRRLRFPDCYNGNGVRFLNEKFIFKPRKKWGVF